MRTRVFRVLAGLLTVLIVWFLLTVDHSGRSLRELVGFGVVAVTFAIFALLGSQPADSWLGLWFGNLRPESPAQRETEMSGVGRHETRSTQEERQSPAAPDQLR